MGTKSSIGNSQGGSFKKGRGHSTSLKHRDSDLRRLITPIQIGVKSPPLFPKKSDDVAPPEGSSKMLLKMTNKEDVE